MKSKVSKLYEYTRADAPDGLCLWRVTDEALEAHLTTLSHSHALENDVPQVQAGDSVVCRGESAVGRWNKPVLLFYPGSGLCEKVIEDALVGMKPGESRTVSASEGDAALTVIRIVRREPHPVNDGLVKLEAVEGVETLADYRRWYRETTEKADRRRNLSYLARRILEVIAERSEYETDEAEETAWVTELAKYAREADEQRGIDPTVPDEGTEFLNEEQVQEKYFKLAKPRFRSYLADLAVVERLSGRDLEEVYEAELAHMAEKYYGGISVEELRKQAPESMMRMNVFFSKAEELLRIDCEKLMED